MNKLSKDDVFASYMRPINSGRGELFGGKIRYLYYKGYGPFFYIRILSNGIAYYWDHVDFVRLGRQERW